MPHFKAKCTQAPLGEFTVLPIPPGAGFWVLLLRGEEAGSEGRKGTGGSIPEKEKKILAVTMESV